MSHIVIIDDRVTNRNILVKLAQSLDKNVDVRAFADPRAAVEWFADHTPDLVITDYKMLSMDGDAFIRQFRRLPFCFDVPVIVVTVYEDRDFRYRALEAGATDFLLSPVDHHEFRARARNLLTLRRQQEIIRKRALTLEQKLRISDRLHKQALHTSAEMLRLVISTVPAMISATDDQGQCIFLNEYQAEFFGVDPAAAGHGDREPGSRARHLERAVDPHVCGGGQAEGQHRAPAGPAPPLREEAVVGVEHRNAVGGQAIDELALGPRDTLE